MLGNFKNGCPHVDLDVAGIANSDSPIKFQALVDTGFNGYLTLAYADAFPLGLVLRGMENSTLADGSVSNHFVCIGAVTIGGNKALAPIDIHPQCNTLVGTALLKELAMELRVNFRDDFIQMERA